MGVDAWGFDRERQAVAHRVRSKRLRLQAVHTAAFGGFAIALVGGGAASMEDATARLGWPSWAALTAFLAILFALFALLELPFRFISGFRWERSMGLSNQTLVGWFKDLAKTLALGLGSTIAVAGVLLWLLATTPWWWLVAWLLGIGVSIGLGFLAPILLVPLFYRLRPIADEALRARFESLAARAGVPILGVFEMRASSKTNRSNAAVMGFGRTRRIVVTDTLLRDFPVDEVDTVLAHELAHQRHLDPLRGFVLGSLTSLAIVAISATVYGAAVSWFGIRSAGDAAGLPLLVVIFSLVALPFRPLELRWSRDRERRADQFALALTGNPAAFAGAMVRLHDRNLGVADPRVWEKWLFYSHPTGRERVDAARAFAATRA
ncbi:MAG TPA: M48 family metallopeptidase [Thermoplasmata archaeon]|nr:M48 family metallopeptidase [Thermoplasmata archaeon]